jgi:hypothetical protein
MPAYCELSRTVRHQYRGTPREQAELAYPPARYFFRPASFVLTPLLIRLGISANQATALGALLTAAAFVLFARGSGSSVLAGALCMTLAGVVDYSDGNLARYNSSHSIFGKFIDGLCDGSTMLHQAAIGLGFLASSIELALVGFATTNPGAAPDVSRHALHGVFA